MKRVPLVALLVAGMVLPAVAGPADYTSRIGRHRENRIFWLAEGQAIPNRTLTSTVDDMAAPSGQKFTTTYLDGIARRFAPGSGHLDLFGSRLGASGPALSGTVDGGAAKLVLRWKTNE